MKNNNTDTTCENNIFKDYMEFINSKDIREYLKSMGLQ